MLKRREKAKIWKYAGGVFGVLFFIGGIYFFIYTPFFKVNSIKIQTNEAQKERVLSALITDIAGNHKFLSVLGPDHIFFWKFGSEATASISVPEIKNVSVETALFKKEISIQTEERRIKYIACGTNYECFRMDEEGIVFKEAPNMEGFLIMKIVDENNVIPIFGKPIVQNETWKKNLFFVMETLRKNNMPVREIRIKEYALREYEAILDSGVSLKFDFEVVPKNFDGILENLSKTISINNVGYIDFRVPNKIFYK